MSSPLKMTKTKDDDVVDDDIDADDDDDDEDDDRQRTLLLQHSHPSVMYLGIAGRVMACAHAADTAEEPLAALGHHDTPR